QRLVGAGVQPSEAAAELFQVQRTVVEVAAVEVGDLQFAARRRLQRSGVVADAGVVEVQAGDGVVRLRLGGFFLQPDHAARSVELGHAVALRILHPVAEHGGAGLGGGGALQSAGKAVGGEDFVGQQQAG